MNRGMRDMDITSIGNNKWQIFDELMCLSLR